ncbi:hypothetical protein DH2020_003308 [Rehmannia glutinosa]|uniref:K Homology domain-containing protein n=1 Tax=Rehmannia glutinosa TaxID=99300 RepID=A0ABR0XL91_REHGL
MGQRSDYGKGSHVPSEISGNEGVKRRNLSDEKEQNSIGIDDTVYRYLCPLRKIGSIIGIGGDIAKQLRAQTHARIRISETIPGCDERVVTIYSTSEETNSYGNEHVCPALDALFKVHDKVVAEESPVNGPFEEPMQVTVRLLVPSDQIGCVIGKGGQIIQNIRNETHAQIRILGSEHLPPCALSSDELVQINGEATVVKSALYQVAFRLHDNPRGGATIKQIRHESGAFIVVDSSGADGDDCIISVSAKEMLEAPSRTIDAIMRLQPRCSEKMERDSGDPVIMTRLLVSSSKVGCIIGKGGAIIKEMRSTSRANIRIFSDKNVPKVASDDDEMVQITGDMNAAKNALLQVMQRLRANVFENDGSSSTDAYDGQKYVHRDNRTRNPGYSNYSGGHTSKTLPPTQSYGSYDESQIGSGYGAYAVYSAGHSTGASDLTVIIALLAISDT